MYIYVVLCCITLRPDINSDLAEYNSNRIKNYKPKLPTGLSGLPRSLNFLLTPRFL